MLIIEQTARRDLMAAVDKLGLSPTARARIAYLKTKPRRSGLDPSELDEEDMELEGLLR